MTNDLTKKAIEILNEKIEEQEEEIRDLKYENENLRGRMEEREIEKLEKKAKLLDKMKVALSGMRNFFFDFDEIFDKVQAGEYIKGSDPIKDIIDDIIKEREKREKNKGVKKNG